MTLNVKIRLSKMGKKKSVEELTKVGGIGWVPEV